MSRAALADEQPRPTGLLAALSLVESGHELAAALVAKGVAQAALLWPLIVLAKFSIPLCLGVAVFRPLDALYGGLLSGMLLMDVLIILLPRLQLFCGQRPHVQKMQMLPLVFLSGLFFSLWLGWAAGEQDVGAFKVVAPELAVALLAVCLFGERRLLAFAYLMGSLLPPLAHGPGLARLSVFASTALVMLIAVVRQAAVDREMALEQQRQKSAAERSNRLLREYEESGRGWFWETDRRGCIVYISDTLLRLLDGPSEGLTGRSLTEIILPDQRQQGERTLGFHLSARTGFSDIAVRAALTREERWWSMSGQPVFNEYGQFQGFRGSGTDLTEMRRSQAEVTRLAQFDSLTGLANRVQMLRSLEQAVGGARGQPGECTLMMLDLDRFKAVNDTLGHPAGDALLRQVSQRLQRVVGDRGLVGRQGGDEFKILLPGRAGAPMLDQLSLAVISALSQPYSVEGASVVIGVSIGISRCPEDGTTADALTRNADLALYAAKGAGRGVHRFYSPEMHADAQERRQLEEDLRNALTGNGLHLVYQPVVSAATERVTGYEALLRWTHPVRGPISPAVFIPIAEDSGLIATIGEWVMRTACRDAVQWPDGVRVAVNVSPSQFASCSFPAMVLSALAAAQLSAERLELEITESVFLDGDDQVDAMIARLKGIGVRLALDDFGTGYSSLAYLQKIPFDKIKIDQSFVRGAATGISRKGAIIKAIVGLADALDMETTAEGAETGDELDLIRRLGCSHVQGYVYGRPLPMADLLVRHRERGTAAMVEGFKSSRAERKAVLRSILVHHDGHAYPARIRNLSASGALIEGLWNVPAGTLFSIELGDQQAVNATARWSEGDKMGVEFASAIQLSVARAAARSMAS